MNEKEGEWPLVTIAIPTYNNAAFIADAVKSAMNQDYKNLQIIIIDDASEDNTAEIVAPFCNDPRILYVKNEKNIGRVQTYHKALYQMAGGEWYLNLDGDDFLTDAAFISKAVGWVKEFDNVVMVAGACERQVNGKLDYTIRSKYDPELCCVDGKTYFLDLPSQKAYFSHLTTLYNRKRAIDLGFYEEDILSADFESIYRLILTGNIVCYNHVVGVWRIHGSNISSNSFFSGDDIFKNFKFVDKTADFAENYFVHGIVTSWKKNYTTQIVESYILKILIIKPANSIILLFQLFKKYPASFSKACFRILSRNIKKWFK